MIYLHADLTLKEKALNSLPGPATSASRYRPPDAVWRASHISDSGPNKVPPEMEEH